MTDQESSPSLSIRLVAALHELITALDSRVPRIERPGEIQIARDAATLRSQAVTRIEALEHVRSARHRYDQELVEAIMTDDGGPLAADAASVAQSP